MNILLVYPKCPDSFWSFTHALKFISKKAAVPPLGLITVSAMLPMNWKKKLIDLNIETLAGNVIQWADYIFISAMYIQKESVDNIITTCKKLNKKIVAGGPLFTQEYENYPQIDHFILNEAEITLPIFLDDLRDGNPKRLYRTDDYADISCSPAPDFNLLSINDYAIMNVQVSRGCPFACDFCEITALLGHKVRMKTTKQVINELEVLYKLNWRGAISIVDDNFIGKIKEVKNKLLPAMIKWMRNHKYPFTFSVQSSIDLADEKGLMSLMLDAGFNSAFIGIETPSKKSLQSCNKVQNKKRDLLLSVKKIHQAGIKVSGGFIVGFDSDSPSVFQQQIDFIQQSGIVSAMVGLLNAPKNTRLFKRLKKENRLSEEATGNNTDFSMNFIPKMNTNELKEGYKKIIENIYSVKPYYKRVRQLLLIYNNRNKGQNKKTFPLFRAFIKSIFIIGLFNKGRGEYWKLIFWTLFKRPGLINDAIIYAVYGYHFRKVYGLR
uniref:B12-binding domain-containing radical SAM protein n=1 Tax=uncultured Draconibacterium sp. TaxID=1573823 RepID=UPI003217D041